MPSDDSQPKPLISFVLATYNRRAILLNTLRELTKNELPRGDYEIIVVDNASSDGTAEAVSQYADVVVPMARNRGSCAKAWGVDAARGPYTLFLDDDSFPRRGSISRLLTYFENDPRLAAAGFRVHLPDGNEECSALPGIPVGCGVAFRTAVLRAVGGLDRTFFMQAEEYDLAFRLAGAGWTVKVFDDLHVEHLKTATARRSERITYFDIRNNLRVIARYLPPPFAGIYRSDWLQRYAWLAQQEGQFRAYRRGCLSGYGYAALERWTFMRRRLEKFVLEQFFCWEELARWFQQLRHRGVNRVVGVDLGKNVYAFHRAAKLAGIDIAGIGDDRFALAGRTYRGAPVVSVDTALALSSDAVVVMNTAAVQAELTHRRVLLQTQLPVFCWFGRNQAKDASRHVGLPTSWDAQIREQSSAVPSVVVR